MARPTLFGHRKFRQLARRLGSRALAVGSLELLWAVANESGDPLIGEPADVEDVADWRGPPGQLADALVACRFLDTTPDGLVVHDHDHHAPRYVRSRRAREDMRRANALSLSDLRRSAARARWAKPDAPDLQVSDHLHASDLQVTASDLQVDATPITHHPSTPTSISPSPKTRDRAAVLHQARKPAREPWNCPHDPPCTSRHVCDLRQTLDQEKAKLRKARP